MFNWYWLPLFPMFVVFFVSALAETNRPPFDLVEAESELVAGFMVEYGSTPYMLFMLGEYVAISIMCAMCTILFLGGWLPPFPLPPFTWIPGVLWFLLKALFVFFMFAMVKAFVPRYRYDQLMRLGWKVFLPLSLAMVAIVAAVLQLDGAGAPARTRRPVDYSLPGFIGAFVGVVIGVINYGVVIAFVEARLRKLDRSQTREERDEFERKISLMRRIVLTIDIVAFSAVGYLVRPYGRRLRSLKGGLSGRRKRPKRPPEG